MKTRITPTILVGLFTSIAIGKISGATILSPASFTVPTTVIDYQNSPVGTLSGGTSITTQYATIGVIHDGSTTTPPGPPGMGSPSGLPGLESSLLISITFTTPVSQVGAFYLMGSDLDSLTLTLFRQDNSIIETTTLASTSMQTEDFSFHEGFLGLLTSENIDHVTFNPSSSVFVIDDLYFGVPEPSQTLLLLTGIFALIGRRKRHSHSAQQGS